MSPNTPSLTLFLSSNLFLFGLASIYPKGNRGLMYLGEIGYILYSLFHSQELHCPKPILQYV